MTSDNIEHVDLIFQNNARLLDETGKDITNEFILENNDSYRTGNYDAILDAIIDQNLAIEDLSTSPPTAFDCQRFCEKFPCYQIL